MLVAKTYFFYKIVNGLSPQYLFNYLNKKNNSNYHTRATSKNNLIEFPYRTERFRYSFFPYCVREWNKLDNSIREAKSIKKFKSMLMAFFNLKQKSLFLIHDPIGVKLLTRLRLKFSHLNEHKFHHNFKDRVTPVCDCGSDI